MMKPSILGKNLFDDFFDNFFDFPGFHEKVLQDTQTKLYGHHAANVMRADIQEHAEHYQVDVDLPGFQKEDLSLELKNGYLIINAEKRIENNETDNGKFVHRERYAGSMSRSFYVGEHVKQEDIHAKYENGVLKLKLPKVENRTTEADEKKYIAIEG